MRWTLVIKAAFPEEKIAYDLIVNTVDGTSQHKLVLSRSIYVPTAVAKRI